MTLQSVNMAAQDEVDVCESWEDMDEIGLDQKIRLMSTDCAPVQTSLKGCKVTVEESACIGSQCVMPEPAIRILKRPSSSGSGQLNGESRARPVKTLEQRQKEYAEARLRILGEARSPEDVIDDNLSRLQDKLQANNLNDNQNNSNKTKSPQTDNNTKGRERKVLSRLPPGATASGVFPSPPPRGVLVIRTPRGPDGTNGFQKSPSRLQDKLQENNLNDNQNNSNKTKSPQTDNNTKETERKVLSRLPPGATASGVFPSPLPPGILVIRTPRRPDGTNGFQKSPSRLQDKLQANNLNDNQNHSNKTKSPQTHNNTKGKKRKVLSRLPPGATASGAFPSPLPPEVLVIRTPRSPDGTIGIQKSPSRLQDKLQANNLNDNQNHSNKTKYPQTDNNTKGRKRKVLSRLPPGATASGVFPSPPPRGVLVIRTTRGPDGTNGSQKSPSRLQDKLQANNLNDNQNHSNKTKYPQTDNNTKGRKRKVLSRLPPGATASGVFPSPPPRGILVIRTTRGPDGTNGSQKR